MRALRGHLQAQPDLIFTLLSTLFTQLLFGTVNHWAITRPILSLMLASEEVRPLPPPLLFLGSILLSFFLSVFLPVLLSFFLGFSRGWVWSTDHPRSQHLNQTHHLSIQGARSRAGSPPPRRRRRLIPTPRGPPTHPCTPPMHPTARKQDFAAYQEHMISTQPSPENQQRLREEFNRLLVDLQRNLEPSNRERMGQKLTVFRVNVQQFLTV